MEKQFINSLVDLECRLRRENSRKRLGDPYFSNLLDIFYVGVPGERWQGLVLAWEIPFKQFKFKLVN